MKTFQDDPFEGSGKVIWPLVIAGIIVIAAIVGPMLWMYAH